MGRQEVEGGHELTGCFSSNEILKGAGMGIGDLDAGHIEYHRLFGRAIQIFNSVVADDFVEVGLDVFRSVELLVALPDLEEGVGGYFFSCRKVIDHFIGKESQRGIEEPEEPGKAGRFAVVEGEGIILGAVWKMFLQGLRLKNEGVQ